MSQQTNDVIKFNWRNDWKLLFTKHSEIFRYKKPYNRDAEVYKPLRIDWVIKYYLWQTFITIYIFLMKPLYKLGHEYFRWDEGEEIILTGRQLRIEPIKRYKL